MDPASVDGRIAQLRTQAKTEADGKRAGGPGKPGETSQAAQPAGAQPQGGRCSGRGADPASGGPCPGSPEEAWTAPEEYEGLQTTEMEEELRQATQGPDEDWLLDAHRDKPFVEGPGRSKHPEAVKRREVIDALLQSGALATLDGASDYLHSHVLARLTQAKVDGVHLEIEQVLLEATRDGGPTLVEEAGNLLDKIGAKAGDPKARADATVSQAVWDETAGLGRGTVEVLGQTWSYLDYQDSLPLDPELAAKLGVRDGEPEVRQCLPLDPELAARLGVCDGEPEVRQCLPLHLAAALLWSANRSEPSLEEVQALGLQMRQSYWEQATAAAAALGTLRPS